jgi:hypothetical protein
MFCPGNVSFRGRFVLETHCYTNLGDGLSRECIVRGQFVRASAFSLITLHMYFAKKHIFVIGLLKPAHNEIVSPWMYFANYAFSLSCRLIKLC